MIQRIKTFLGINKGITGLLVMVVLVGLGEKMAERFLPLYLTALGASLLVPGLLNGLDVFLSAVYSIPGGWSTAKYGYKKSLLMFNIMAMVGYIIVILIPNWIAVIVGSFFFLSWTSLSLPAAMELIRGEVPKNKQVMGVSLHSLVRRIPMALGPIIGGVLIDRMGITAGIRMAFVLALILGIISTLIQQFTLKKDAPQGDGHAAFISLTKFPSGLRWLLASDILVRYCEQMPYAYIAIWAVNTAGGAGVTASQFGVLSAIEMMVALLVYVPVAYFADQMNKKPFVVITYLFFTLFPLTLWFSTSFALLVIAFVIRGLKEFGEPTRKSLIMDLAPEGQKPVYFGSYYFYRDVIVTGSTIIGAFLWEKVTPAATFIVSTLFGLAGTTVFAIWGKNQN
ncbi:MAG TPA: MFS transporter [Bacteroidales bacterium]